MLDELSDRITIKQYGRGFLLGRKPASADIQAAQEGYEEIKKILLSKEYDMVVLDEANVAVHYGLITVQDILDCIAENRKALNW
jgi:cob(I)alamin adenosyltransferase